MKNNYSKTILLSFFAIILLVFVVIGVSFAAFSYTGSGTKVNTITTGIIKMSYIEPTNAINLEDALPMSDSQGMSLSGVNNVFDFTVEATIRGSGTTIINYTISAVKESSTVSDSSVKVYLTNMDNNADTEILAPTKISNLSKTGASESSGVPSGQYELATGTFSATGSHKYRLRMWVADDFTDLDSSGSYKLKVNVYGAAAAQ